MKKSFFRFLVGTVLAAIGAAGKLARKEDAPWFTLLSLRGGEPRHHR